jgi:hypothetical protein
MRGPEKTGVFGPRSRDARPWRAAPGASVLGKSHPWRFSTSPTMEKSSHFMVGNRRLVRRQTFFTVCQFDFCSFRRHEKSPVAEVGGAHAPSPDVRCGPPALRSLGAGCQGMGTTSQDHPDSAGKHARDVLSSSSSRRHGDRVFESSGQLSGTPQDVKRACTGWRDSEPSLLEAALAAVLGIRVQDSRRACLLR